MLYLLSTTVYGSNEYKDSEKPSKCGEQSKQLKYIWGDALTDSANCIGPNNIPYPS